MDLQISYRTDIQQAQSNVEVNIIINRVWVSMRPPSWIIFTAACLLSFSDSIKLVYLKPKTTGKILNCHRSESTIEIRKSWTMIKWNERKWMNRWRMFWQTLPHTHTYKESLSSLKHLSVVWHHVVNTIAFYICKLGILRFST